VVLPCTGSRNSWTPDGIKLAQVAPPLIVVYVVAVVGSIGGGWLSSFLIKARLDGQSGA